MAHIDKRFCIGRQGVTLKPQWNRENSSVIFYDEDVEIELKAYIVFYMLVLWPNQVRCLFNTLRIEGHINENMDKSKHTWNQDCYGNVEEFNLWFPKEIFPNGLYYDDDAIVLSTQYKAALDLLVDDCFRNKKMIIKKLPNMGIGWFADSSCGCVVPLDMSCVANNTTGYNYYFLINMFNNNHSSSEPYFSV